MEEAQPRERSSLGPILLLVLAVGGSAVGVALYQHMQAAPAPSSDNSGFDLSQTTEARRPALTAGGGAAQSAAPQSSLTGASWGALAKIPAAGAGGPGDLKAQAVGFADMCRKYEDRVRAMAEKYTRESPVVQAYGKEWMSYPDLKKLNDDYMINHDPVAFLHGLAQSKNFGLLVKKYAGSPVFMRIAQDAMKSAPTDLRQTAMDYINKDQIAGGVLDNVMQALGLPAGILGANTAGANQAPSFDPSKMLNGIMGSQNPDLQKQLQNDPNFQQKLKSINNK